MGDHISCFGCVSPAPTRCCLQWGPPEGGPQEASVSLLPSSEEFHVINGERERERVVKLILAI